jgi:chromosome segregation ATPase
MLGALRDITGRKGKRARKQTDELELLIGAAREERGALGAMLTSLTNRSAKLTPLGRSLEQITEQATGITSRLDDITKRLGTLDARATHLEEVEQRVQALKEAVRQAEQTTQKAIGQDGELKKHREAFQQLSAQALQIQVTLDTVKKEHAALEALRGQLRLADQEVKQSLTQAGMLKTELDRIGALTTTLTQDCAKIREVSREARDLAQTAMVAVKEIDSKLGPLARLLELSQSTEERLNALKALPESAPRPAPKPSTKRARAAKEPLKK